MVGEPVHTYDALVPEHDPVSTPAPTPPPADLEGEPSWAHSLIEGPYVPSPEDFAPSPPKPRSPLSGLPGPGALRPALLCFAFFFIASIRTWYAPDANGYWVSREAVFQHHEYWRLLTALFTHADMEHILSNAPLFLIFGWYLRAFFGFWIFPAGALVIGVLSNLATVFFYEPQMELVGASGMLYGMVALWLILYVRFESVHTVTVRIFRAVAVSLLLLFPTTFHAQTSYLAHVMGFLIGLGVGYVMAPWQSVKVQLSSGGADGPH